METYKIKVGGTMNKAKIVVVNSTINHCIDHFKKEPLSEITLPLGSFKLISRDMAKLLDEIHDDEKILEGLKSCDLRKSP